ncbi:MAG: hypothetical protein ACRELB_25150, partial [Polyangiaceae bacterium]
MRATRQVRSAARARGSALIAALVVVVVFLGLTGALVVQSVSASRAQTMLERSEGVRRALEGGVGIKLAELNTSNTDMSTVYGTMSGGVAGEGRLAAGVRYAVKTAPVAGDTSLIFIAAAAGNADTERRAVLIVKKATQAMSAGLRAGLQTYGGTLSLSNNVTINGNDHDLNGNSITSAQGGANTFAVSNVGTVSVGNQTTVTGNGSSTTGTFNTSNVQQNAVWTPSQPYPTEPDNVVNLPNGTLKAMAQASGTYFSTEAAFSAYQAATPNIPGGVVIYLDFNMSSGSGALNWNAGMNSVPSVFVNHSESSPPSSGVPNGTSDLGNVHMSFKGLMIFDTAKHFNAQTTILGGLVSLANGAQSGNVFANGGFSLNYSSKVLAGLPAAAVSGQPVSIKSWT